MLSVRGFLVVLLIVSSCVQTKAERKSNLPAQQRDARLKSETLATLAEMLPKLSLTESGLSALLTYEESSRKRASDEAIAIWQNGDYPVIEDIAKTFQGEKLWGKISHYSQLSREEKLLLRMEWTFTDSHDLTSWQALIARMNVAGLREIKGWDDTPKLWHSRDQNELSALFKRARQDKTVFERILKEEWFPRFASPVTGRFFESWHKEFSPGNGYIFQITDEAELKLIESAVNRTIRRRAEMKLRGVMGISTSEEPITEEMGAVRETQLSELNLVIEEAVKNLMNKSKFFYFRIYGRKKDTVIAEGIWRVNDYQKSLGE